MEVLEYTPLEATIIVLKAVVKILLNFGWPLLLIPVFDYYLKVKDRRKQEQVFRRRKDRVA